MGTYRLLLGLLGVAALCGCILGGGGGDDADALARAEEDEFLEKYLAGGKTGGKVIDVPRNVENRTAKPQTTTTTTLKPKPCPWECCNETGYEQKGCGRWFACIDRRCADRPCPGECCVLGDYQEKRCRSPLECVNYTCVKPACPTMSECCPAADYTNPRECGYGFACRGGVCVSVDTDGDSLADAVERNYGTDPFSNDTDGDGLSDYVEVKITGSNPLAKNTDGDRYDDAVDERPTVTDSALIRLTPQMDQEVDAEVKKAILMRLAYGQPLPENGTVLARFESNIALANTGTDYTDYVNYTLRVRYWCPANAGVPGVTNETYWPLKDIRLHGGRVQAGSRYVTHHSHNITVGDIPKEALAPLAYGRGCKFDSTVTGFVYYEHYF